MAVIKSGSSTNQLEITSQNAAKVTVYDTFGNPVQEYPSYMACTNPTVVAPADTTPFFAIYGSSSKKIRVKSIIVSGATLTAIEYNVIKATKYSTAITGGTATELVRVPLDSTNGAAMLSILNVYTAAPTVGTNIGTIGSKRILLQDTTAVSDSLPVILEFDGFILNTPTEGVCLSFGVAPATAVTLSIEVQWEEI